MKTAGRLAIYFNTPIPFFLNMPLDDLWEWVDIANSIREGGG